MPQKIAILGGGVGSLTTAFELTSVPNWQDNYEITVYQLGWRLGGKGASGRGPCGRIEEHGLHIWCGFYDNAFRVIRAAYEEMGRPPGTPLATWLDAFKPHSYNMIIEHIEGRWIQWPIEFPTNASLPGDPGDMPSPWQYITMTLQALHSHFKAVSSRKGALTDQPETEEAGVFMHFLHDLERETEVVALTLGERLLQAALALTVSLSPFAEDHLAKDHRSIVFMLDGFRNWLWSRLETQIEQDDELRRLWILADLGMTNIRGIIEDGVLYHQDGLDIIDGLDYRAWLQKHGATELAYRSALVQGLYDLVFAYIGGDPEQPSFAAGAALRSIARIALTYKGAIFWKMQAGMGDTIFTPLYEVLKKRGVQFKFFHRVKNLGLSADKTTIATIRIGRQATLKPDVVEYQPLVRIRDLDCWPAVPDFGQLVEGDALQAQNINLESFWTPWQDVEEITLEAGKDFDKVVLGIPVGSLPYLCPELIAASPAWDKMVKQVQTVRTMALQLWIKRDLEGLGWMQPPVVLDAYAQPLNTWADMTHLLDREDWPEADAPQNIAYFCGPMLDETPPVTDPAAETAQVRQASDQWLAQSSAFLWPKAAPPGNPSGFDTSLIVDTHSTGDPNQPDGAFWRANIDPSERYVLSVAGSTEARLRAGESGFANLILAGDWIRNEFNAGCVEAAVMSGMQAAHAICGFPKLEDIEGQFHI